jgi:hypothetical protein
MSHWTQNPFEPNDNLGLRLTRTLTTPPAVSIPRDFAARTAALAFALPQSTAFPKRASFSSRAIQCVFAALTLAMLALIPYIPNERTLYPLALQLLLATEFVALTTWLSLRRPNKTF